jgi:hypothetical protein
MLRMDNVLMSLCRLVQWYETINASPSPNLVKSSCSLEVHLETFVPIKLRTECLSSLNQFVLREFKAFRQLLMTRFVSEEEMDKLSYSTLTKTSVNLFSKLSFMDLSEV